MINIILGVSVLDQSRQLGGLPVAFDEGQDFEVDSSPLILSCSWIRGSGRFSAPSILKIGWQGGKERAMFVPQLSYIDAPCALMVHTWVVVVTGVPDAPFGGVIFCFLTKSRLHHSCGSCQCPF